MNTKKQAEQFLLSMTKFPAQIIETAGGGKVLVIETPYGNYNIELLYVEEYTVSPSHIVKGFKVSGVQYGVFGNKKGEFTGFQEDIVIPEKKQKILRPRTLNELQGIINEIETSVLTKFISLWKEHRNKSI